MEQRLKDKLQALANEVVQTLIEKDDIYGSSWKSHEGFSAFFNTQRKWSRIEKMSADNGYDLFAAVRSAPEGEDAMKDLIGYALLTLSETHVLDHDLLIQKFLHPSVRGCGEPGLIGICGIIALCQECWSMGNEDAAHLIEKREMIYDVDRQKEKPCERDDCPWHRGFPTDGGCRPCGRVFSEQKGDAGPDYVDQD